MYEAFANALRTLPGWNKLSARELEVLEAVVIRNEHGSQVASRLSIAIGTYEAHWTHIINKLGYSRSTPAYNTGRRLEHDILIEYGRQLERLIALQPEPDPPDPYPLVIRVKQHP